MNKAVVYVSGTNGLQMTLMLARIKQNIEVITQPLTFIAIANGISYYGVHPIFVNIDKGSLSLSCNALETPKTKTMK